MTVRKLAFATAFPHIEVRWRRVFDDLLALALMIIGIIGAWIACRSDFWRIALTGTQRTQVGMVSPVAGGVRMKSSDSMIWIDLFQSEHVADGDAVYTGSKAVAKLKIGEEQVTLEPETLITVHDQKKVETGSLEPVFEIVKGRVKVQVPKMQKAFKIRSRTRQIEIAPVSSPTEFELGFDEKSPGQDEISIAHSKTPLQVKSMSLAKSGGSAAVETIVVRPGIQTVLATERAAPVILKTDDLKAESNDVAMAPAPVAVEAVKPGAADALKAAQEAAAGKPASPPTLEVLPTLLLEQAGRVSTRVQTIEELHELPVMLRWRPLEGIAKYQVTITDSANKVLLSENVLGSQYKFTLKSLAVNRYLYRVAARWKDGRIVRSRPRQMSVELAPPVLKHPGVGGALAWGTRALFTWEKTSLTRGYEVQISRNAEFTALLGQKVFTKNLATYQPPSRGRYFWRVRALTSPELKSPWSAPRWFEVK